MSVELRELAESVLSDRPLDFCSPLLALDSESEFEAVDGSKQVGPSSSSSSDSWSPSPPRVTLISAPEDARQERLCARPLRVWSAAAGALLLGEAGATVMNRPFVVP